MGSPEYPGSPSQSDGWHTPPALHKSSTFAGTVGCKPQSPKTYAELHRMRRSFQKSDGLGFSMRMSPANSERELRTPHKPSQPSRRSEKASEQLGGGKPPWR